MTMMLQSELHNNRARVLVDLQKLFQYIQQNFWVGLQTVGFWETKFCLNIL